MVDSPNMKSYKIPQLEGGFRPGYDAIFNSDSKSDIITALDAWDSRHVLLVFSKSLSRNTTYISELKSGIGTRLVAFKEGVGAHSPYHDLIDIGHLITNYAIDCIISVGSGSYSDACKAARLLSATLPPNFGEAEMEALIDPKLGIAPQDVMKKPEGVKLILVPTSLSAGEWNFAASCTNSAGKKQHFGLQDGGAADLILMDPWLAKTAPEQLWLSSGVRAIDHCIETLCNPKSSQHPDAQKWCEDALRDLTKGLAEYKEGLQLNQHESALIRGVSKCQAGSRLALMSYIIYRIPMGPSHAIGHQLGSMAGVMHGITSCIMLPPVLRFTKDKTADQQSRIVHIFNETMGWKEKDAADCVARLVELLELPRALEQVGVTDIQQIQQIIDSTLTDALFSIGLVSTKQDIADIVLSARNVEA